MRLMFPKGKTFPFLSRLFNWAKGRMKTFTSEGGMASRVPTAAVSESGMLNYFCLRIRPICYPFWNSWGRNVINNRLLDLLFRQAALSLVPLGLFGGQPVPYEQQEHKPPVFANSHVRDLLSFTLYLPECLWNILLSGFDANKTGRSPAAPLFRDKVTKYATPSQKAIDRLLALKLRLRPRPIMNLNKKTVELEFSPTCMSGARAINLRLRLIGLFKARLDVVELLWGISYLRLRLSSCSGSVFNPFKELPSIMSTRIDYSYSASSYNELKKIPEADLLAKGYNAGRLYRDLRIQRLDKVSHYTPGFSSSCTLTLSYGLSRGKGTALLSNNPIIYLFVRVDFPWLGCRAGSSKMFRIQPQHVFRLIGRKKEKGVIAVLPFPVTIPTGNEAR
ncbi:unnamed protein product [Vicia faba]|uniref:Uncharacterized protein n=1 Tax=Vicia faba TaxID=3906 RepID=A0AAV1B8R2_VICFA|nr:unnamed protein product [Vicia faba]